MLPHLLGVPQWRIQGRGPGGRPPKNFFGDRAPLLSQGLDDRPPPPPLSEGLDPPLCPTFM